MGAKDWMVVYADGEVAPVLHKAPPPDRAAARALVERLWPDHEITELPDGNLGADANPQDGQVYVGCFDGLTIVCTNEVVPDSPWLPERFQAEARGRTLYLHAMNSVIDWATFAVWQPDGTPRRAVSLSLEMGIIEEVGDPLEFEVPFWAGERADEDVDEDYPFPFHPQDLAEGALREFFGFNFEGVFLDVDQPHLEKVVLHGFEVSRR